MRGIFPYLSKKVFHTQTDSPRSRMHVYEPNPQQPQFPFPIPRSQFPFPNSQPNVENFDANEDDEKDWFLEAFLIGYKTEKDRRKRLGAEKEERKKKEVAREKYEKERRREERVNFENKLMEELKDMKNTLETMEVEERKLRQEVEEMRRSMKEEKIVKIVVEIRNGDDKVTEVDIPQIVNNVIPTQVLILSPKSQAPSPKP